MNRLFIFAVLFSAFQSLAYAAPYDDLKATFQPIADSFHARYALADFKQQRFGWTIDGEVQKLLGIASANPNLTAADANVLLNQFFTDARDYHAQVILKGQPYLEVRIGVHSASQRVFVTNIKTPAATGAIQLGDEVLTYDGVPVWKALNALVANPINHYRTDLRDAERKLTARYGMLVDPIPTTPTLTLTLRNSAGLVYTQVLNWGSGASAQKSDMPRGLITSSHIPASLQGVMDDPFGYLSVKSYLPKPKNVSWESASGSVYYAWTGTLPSGKRIGMIRINDFGLSSDAEFAAAVAEFKP